MLIAQILATYENMCSYGLCYFASDGPCRRFSDSILLGLRNCIIEVSRS